MWAIKCKFEGNIFVFSEHASKEEAEQQLKEYREVKEDFYKDFWVEEATKEQLLKDLHIHKGCRICNSLRLKTIEKVAFDYLNLTDNDETTYEDLVLEAIDKAAKNLGITLTTEEINALQYHIITG
jgi:hypothetical protein